MEAPLTEEAIADAKAADAVLMGSIGGNTTTSPWYKLPLSEGLHEHQWKLL